MKKRRSAGSVFCFNSKWNGGASTVTRKVGVTADVLLSCLLHSFQQARKHEPEHGLGIGLRLASTKANKNMRATIYVIGGPEQALANIDLPD
jgi:hypothetical protein